MNPGNSFAVALAECSGDSRLSSAASAFPAFLIQTLRQYP
jgi:hypothetical protein